MLTSTAWLAASLVVSSSPYQVDWAGDSVATGAFLLLEAGMGVAEKSLPGGLACKPLSGTDHCNPATLNVIDRSVVGDNSGAWRTVSDVGQTGTIVLAAVGMIADALQSNGASRWLDAGTDSLVLAESMAVATATTYVLKFAVRRPRPTQYVSGAEQAGVDGQFSFPSGHATAVAAASTVFTTTFFLRHPDSPWRWPVAGLAAVLTGLTAYGRVGGGMHFYSDVAVGIVVGAATGFLVPYLHNHQASLDAAVAEDCHAAPAPQLRLSLVF